MYDAIYKYSLETILDHITAIGENLKNTSRKHNLLEENYPEIEWDKIIRFRDFISHHYEMLDYEIVYEICKVYLPKLEVVIKAELGKF
jgi:uncharacterized protein with HEPN domain